MEILITQKFDRKWKKLNLTDSELDVLCGILEVNPQKGDVISGTLGVRKLRINIRGKGKRGGARVIYVYIQIDEKIYLLDVYSKSQKEKLTKQELKQINNLIKSLESME